MISPNKMRQLLLFCLLCLSGCVRPIQVERVPIYFVAHSAFNLDEYVSEFEKRYPQFEIYVTYLFNVPDDWPYHFDAALFWNKPYESDLLLDLKPLIESDQQFESEDFYPGALAAGYETLYTRVDDRLIGLPVGLEFEALAYRSDLVAQTGIDVSSPTWSWQTLLDTAHAVSMSRPDPEQTAAFSDDLDRNTVLFNWLHVRSAFYAYVEGNLVPTLDYVGLEAALSDACRILPDLSVAIDPQIGPPAGYQPLAYLDEGRAVMTTYPIQSFFAQKSDHPDLAMMAFPQPNLFQELKANGVLSISRGTQNVQATWTWVRFLSQNLLPSASADLPARKSVAEAAHTWERMDTQAAQIIQTILAGQAQLPDWPERELVNRFRLSMIKAVLEACHADVPPAEALSHAQQSAQAAADLWYGHDTEFEPFAVVPQVAPSQDEDILYLVSTSSDAQVYADVSSAFESQHPGWQVQAAEPGPATQNIDVLIMDICSFDWPGFLYAQQNMYAIDTLHEISLNQETFNPQSLSVVSWHNRTLGVPLSMRPLVLYYHAATFAELDMPIPTSDWTVGDVLEAAAKIQAANPRLIGYAPVSGSEVQFVLEQQGISLFESDRLTPRFVSSQVLEALERLGSLQANGAILAPSFSASVMQLPVGFSGQQTYRGETMNAVALVPRAGVRWPMQVTLAGVHRSSQQTQVAWDWVVSAHQLAEGINALPANQSLLDGQDVWLTLEQNLGLAFSTALARSKNLPGRDDAALIQDAALWWFELALRQTSGEDLETALLQAQDKAAQFTACMSAAAEVEPSTLAKCARDVDDTHPLAQVVP